MSLALIGAYELAAAEEATPPAVGARDERLRPFIERTKPRHTARPRRSRR